MAQRSNVGRTASLSVLVALALLLLAAPAPAGAARLVLERADAPGFKPAKASPVQARAALGRGLPRGLARALRRAPAESARFARAGWSLRSSAVVLRDASAARGVLAGWARSQRRARARVRSVPRLIERTPGTLAVRRARRGSELAIAWREGRAVGLVELRAASRSSRVAAALTRHARLAAVRLFLGANRSEYDRLAGAVGRRGPTPRQALEAFAMAVAPLPGVKAPRLRLGAVRSGTQAVRWVQRVRARLSPGQRAAIDRALARLFGTAAGASAAGARAAAEDFVESVEGKRVAESMRDRIAARLGRSLQQALVVGASKTPHGAANATALPDPALKTCRIAVYPKGVTEYKGDALEFLLAHEVFHCFQFELVGGATRYLALPEWLGEGTAEWVGFDASGISRDPGQSLSYYALIPRQGLFDRDYDAAGFFGHAQEAGVDPWTQMQAMLSGSSEAAYAAAGGRDDGFLRRWGSSTFRIARLGPDWVFREPLPVPESIPTPAPPIYNLGSVGVEAYRTAQYEIHALDRPIMRVDIGGRARLTDGSLDTAGLDEAWFCLEKKCECPKGTEGNPPPTQQLGRVSRLALTGTPEGQGTGGTITPYSLEEWCKKKPEPPSTPKPPSGIPPAGCGAGGGGCGTTNGDPHLVTFDRLKYDFQAAGEFVLARGADGFEVQARQEPIGNSKLVTVNTALAMRVGGRRVMVSAGMPLGVSVDGQPRRLTPRTPIALDGGGRVRELSKYVVVEWPDGTEVRLWSVGRWGVALTIKLAASQAGRLAGLLGNYDGDPANDLTTREGEVLDRAVGRAANADAFAQLYRRFGEGWRLRAGESLFDYEPGKSSASYTDRSVPKNRYDAASLDAAARARAERICRAAGITDPDVLQGCILDVAVSSDEEFAVAGAVQELTERFVPPVVVPPVTPVTPAEPETPMSWNQIAAYVTRTGLVGLGTTPDGVLHTVATVREGGVDRIVHLPIGADGAIGSATTVDPHLGGRPQPVADPAGYLRIVVAGIRQQVPTTGTFTYAKATAGGPWAPGAVITTQGNFYLGGPAAVYGPGNALFTVSTGNEAAAVFRDFPNTLGAALRTNNDCYASRPAIAWDGAELWAAWLQWDCADVGQWVRPINPATGVPSAPPAQVPQSTAPRGTSVQGVFPNPRSALATRPGQPGVFLAYAQPVGFNSSILVWRLGSPAPFEIAQVSGDPESIFLTSEPSGRLWVAWEADERLRAKRLTADAGAADPALYKPALPPGVSANVEWAVQARDGRLDIVAGTPTTATVPGTSFHAALAP